jgi:AhpC/TSA family
MGVGRSRPTLACRLSKLPVHEGGPDTGTSRRHPMKGWILPVAGRPGALSWCAACIQEMPELQKVYVSAAGAVQFLGVDLLGVEGETRSGAESFARQRSVTYPLAYDEGGLLYGRVSLRVLAPTTAFVRADGTLAGIHIGQLDAAELRGLIARYLGIQVPA